MNERADILVVDDNPVNVRLLSQMLKARDYRVRTAGSGERALAAARSESPDLILLDVMMPDLDGYEVCSRLKADEATADIPIIFISALGEAKDKVRAFEVGGVDYVTKPLQIEEIEARLQTHLSIQRLRRELQAANRELSRRLDELDEMNAKLQAQNEELIAYDRSVSHDLKNTIGFIAMTAEFLVESFDQLDDAQLRSLLRDIARRGYKANSIVESLLLLAQPGPVPCEPLDMSEIVETAVDGLHAMIEKYDADLRIPDTFPEAQGQTALVERVWDNYISNAIKYGGDPPLVVLGAERLDDGWVRFWVQDNGEGVKPEDRERIFDAFTRYSDGRIEGHGLGLSIAKRIVQKMDGEVAVEDARWSDETPDGARASGGSRFSFTLPGPDVDLDAGNCKEKTAPNV
jgi:signal transduction histidine kinase